MKDVDVGEVELTVCIWGSLALSLDMVREKQTKWGNFTF